jgi:ABC-2 type transport system permease protein
VTLEEKENRVTEMILTTMSPTTLIMGKVVALVVVGVLQMAIMTLPLWVGLQVFGTSVKLPSIDLSAIPISPVPTLVGFLIFLGGFLLFSGILVAVGSIMPNAREAGSAFGVVIIAMFAPLYAVNLVISEPSNPIVQVFTYFPLTAPICALLRNALGTLALWEAAIVLVILFAFAALFLSLGVRLFRTGSISYSGRLDVRKALGIK